MKEPMSEIKALNDLFKVVQEKSERQEAKIAELEKERDYLQRFLKSYCSDLELAKQGSFLGTCSNLEYSNKDLSRAEIQMQYQEALKEQPKNKL